MSKKNQSPSKEDIFDHPLLAKIRERAEILEETILGVRNKKVSPEIGATIARLSDSDSRYRREILNEAIFDAKHHPAKPKPYFADAAGL